MTVWGKVSAIMADAIASNQPASPEVIRKAVLSVDTAARIEEAHACVQLLIEAGHTTSAAIILARVSALREELEKQRCAP